MIELATLIGWSKKKQFAATDGSRFSKYPLWNSYAVYERLKILSGYVGLRRSISIKCYCSSYVSVTILVISLIIASGSKQRKNDTHIYYKLMQAIFFLKLSFSASDQGGVLDFYCHQSKRPFHDDANNAH
ncbi:hypothetical protein T07_5081 [Trichinella nelsoni]|uniref:Uncharacterized protein n=1 Tax=Trichinella nelsoni TaxID=6336 RepID=A0A0V0RQ18_9BILA|nr:hypothetical protein T07_5081 [Trichinella nelsoni]